MAPNPPEDDAPDGVEAPGTGPPRRRRWWVWALAGVVVMVGVLGAIVVWGGSTGREVTPEEAAERLGETNARTDDPAELRPPEGLYLYRGSGTDELSTPPKQQTQGPDMPATVTHEIGGCWTFRIDYHSYHWQEWEYCPRDGGLDEMGGTTYQKWDFGVFESETTSEFACDPAVTIRTDQDPGDDWSQTCEGGDESVGEPVLTTGPHRFVGPETLDIGGEMVEALHYHRERTMSGGQRGSEQTDVWFSAADGMPLRNERSIEVRVDSVIGETVYTEIADFELTSLVPQS